MQIIRMFRSFIVTIASAIIIGHALPSSAADSMRNEAQPQPSSLSLSPSLDSGALNRLILGRLDSMESRNDDPKDSADLMRKFSNKKVNAELNEQKQEYLQANKQKVVLKKKWHKLVDDLIDGEFASDSYASAKSRGQKRDSYKKKKWVQPDGDDNGKNVVIIVKKPPNYADGDDNSEGSGNPSQGSMNSVNSWDIGRDQRREEGISNNRRPAVNMAEHAKKILDDGFGVMRESKFTTNNHLGLKGVPKFGSEEEY